MTAHADAIIVMEDIHRLPMMVNASISHSKVSDPSKILNETPQMGSFNVFPTKSPLNAIDGIAAQEGRVIFLTTNFKEKLPPSLIRNGRIDKKIFIGHATEYQTKTFTQ
nr:unnamed protein product [Naegleria fowleri]